MINLRIWHILWFTWLIAMNALGAYLTTKDKLNAIKREWRVKESHLFWVAFLGGALGIYAGMQAMRHKTKKFFFYMGIPMLCWYNVFLTMTLLIFVL